MPLVITDDKTFEINPDDNLLNALEKTGHRVEYQCRSGYCGSCRLTLISGSVSYVEPPLAFITSDEILPCCCRVNSDIKLACRSVDNQPDLFETDFFSP